MKNQKYPFVSPKSFLDPLFRENGDLYAPWRYKEIVRDCYSISKTCNTSYMDVVQMTPRERDYIIEFIVEDHDRLQEEMENRKKQYN